VVHSHETPAPHDPDAAEAGVEEAAERSSVRPTLRALYEGMLVGRSPTIARLRERVATIGRSDAAVLVTGESGTGKELVARMLHMASPRASRAFVAVNCAAFPETLLEAELFGHERGAFTGAVQRRAGRFAAAHGGTLFLDEIADVPPAAQAKLLRVLETGVYQPLGTNADARADVRLVSASNADLVARVAEGRFREDIFHRIKVFQLRLPPLRERRADLPLLVEHFSEKLLGPRAREVRFAASAWAALVRYDYPGNVRELKHVVEHAIVLARGGLVTLEQLPAELGGGSARNLPGATLEPLGKALKTFEREYLLGVLRACGWHRTRAAELLGVTRKTLWLKLREHGLAEGESD
jgi:DNA-binding NtrC family response regulator